MGTNICSGQRDQEHSIKFEANLLPEQQDKQTVKQVKSKFDKGESVSKILQKWRLFKYKADIVRTINLRIFDKKVGKVGKIMSEEDFLSKLHPTVLMVENSKNLQSIIPNKKKIRDFTLIFKGPIKLLNGDCYKGEWNLQYKRHGFGVLICIDGSKYEGSWKDDIINGFGRFLYTNGDYYEGEWKDGKAHGKGSLKKLDGSYYDGEWKMDVKQGFGEEVFEGARYLGEFNDGNKCGKGRLYLPNGAFYEGDFSGNAFNGRGKIIWSQGDSFEGEWKNSKMHGSGVFTWTDGRKYIGEYREDQKEGFGMYYWTQNKYYEGFWRKGKRDGPGKVYKNNKTNYYLFKGDKVEKEIDKNAYEATLNYMKGLKDLTASEEKEIVFISNGLKNGI